MKEGLNTARRLLGLRRDQLNLDVDKLGVPVRDKIRFVEVKFALKEARERVFGRGSGDERSPAVSRD